MKKTFSSLFSLLLLTIMIAGPAKAQFEGKIQYSSYEFSSDGSKEKSDDFTMFITPERILLQGNNEYKVMGSIKTEGILVRLDFEDFVFLSGDQSALKISKADITSMMNMFDNGSKNSRKELEDTDVDYEKTGEKSSIKGYSAEKFIFRDKEAKNEHSVVWMTRDIDVNWGMLAEPWGNSSGQNIAAGLPTDLIFKEKHFPLKMENYKNDKLVGMTEVTEISRSNVARGMVQVPSGIKVLSFQDYLFQKMNDQY